MAHTFTSLFIPVVFSTAGRASLLPDAIRPEVHGYLGGILRELQAVPIAIGGTADHVHLLMRLPEGLSAADCLSVEQARSQRRCIAM